MNTTRSLLLVAFACGLAGCGERDTKSAADPELAASEAAAAANSDAREPADEAKAGINSAGLPAGSAGGNPGAPEVIGTPQQEPQPEPTPRDSPPRRTDVPASGGPGSANMTPSNERKPMPNDGETANTPGSLPPPPP